MVGGRRTRPTDLAVAEDDMVAVVSGLGFVAFIAFYDSGAKRTSTIGINKIFRIMT